MQKNFLQHIRKSEKNIAYLGYTSGSISYRHQNTSYATFSNHIVFVRHYICMSYMKVYTGTNT